MIIVDLVNFQKMNLLKSFLDLYVRKYVGIGDFMVRFMSGKVEMEKKKL